MKYSTPWILAGILAIFALASRPASAQDSSYYAVFTQSFSETRITDGQAGTTRTRATYLSLMDFDGSSSNRSFRTWQLTSKRAYTLIEDESVISTCRILNQGSRKILITWYNSLPAGRHFSSSTSQLFSYPVAGRNVLLPRSATTRGLGVPTDSDPNYKEYSVASVLDLPATRYVNEQDPASDEEAEAALIAYYTSKGFAFPQ